MKGFSTIELKQLAIEALNSYSMLLFSTNSWVGGALLIVTFFSPFAGLVGLISVLISIMLGRIANFDKLLNQPGLFHFNAIWIGLGMATFYNSGFAFWLLLFLAVFFSLLLSIWFAERLFPRGLPFLALPFILSFWVVILVSRELSAIDLTTRNIYWLNNMYAIGDSHLINFILFFENLPLDPLVLIFFKSLSSLLFQENVFSGIMLSLILLFHSRISFLLVVLGYIISILFNNVVYANDNGLNYYFIGSNFIMVALAIGSFFTIPSVYSFFWSMLAVPLSFLMVIALGKLTALLNLPVYSLPFCVVTILIVHFFNVSKNRGRVVITPLQFYSPEKNLYNYLNAKKRFFYDQYFRLQLPFLGEWIVTQGYDGEITHKGEWAKALDFVIVDGQMKTYSKPGLEPDNFYCYNKPVLAPADGYVQEVVENVEDNEVGTINRKENWGNSIVLKHFEGLYTKLSHLRKHSIKVKVGDYVKQGDIIAACGNSGRSPEPHLHFQVQSTPYIGSKTMAYPMSTYSIKSNGKVQVMEYAVPSETNKVSNLNINSDLDAAFNFQPGFRMNVHQEGMATDANWEVYTDAYNKTYLFCHLTKSLAYFTRALHFFYFNSFYGDYTSLLYKFYVSAYKIALFVEPNHLVKDEFPLQLSRSGFGMWMQDLIAPFGIYRHLEYESANMVIDGAAFNQAIEVRSRQHLSSFNHEINSIDCTITISNKLICAFSFLQKGKKINVLCK